MRTDIAKWGAVIANAQLWGPDADPTLKVSIDAFEPYLEPA